MKPLRQQKSVQTQNQPLDLNKVSSIEEVLDKVLYTEKHYEEIIAGARVYFQEHLRGYYKEQKQAKLEQQENQKPDNVDNKIINNLEQKQYKQKKGKSDYYLDFFEGKIGLLLRNKEIRDNLDKIINKKQNHINEKYENIRKTPNKKNNAIKEELKKEEATINSFNQIKNDLKRDFFTLCKEIKNKIESGEIQDLKDIRNKLPNLTKNIFKKYSVPELLKVSFEKISEMFSVTQAESLIKNTSQNSEQNHADQNLEEDLPLSNQKRNYDHDNNNFELQIEHNEDIYKKQQFELELEPEQQEQRLKPELEQPEQKQNEIHIPELELEKVLELELELEPEQQEQRLKPELEPELGPINQAENQAENINDAQNIEQRPQLRQEQQEPELEPERQHQHQHQLQPNNAQEQPQQQDLNNAQEQPQLQQDKGNNLAPEINNKVTAAFAIRDVVENRKAICYFIGHGEDLLSNFAEITSLKELMPCHWETDHKITEGIHISIYASATAYTIWNSPLLAEISNINKSGRAIFEISHYLLRHQGSKFITQYLNTDNNTEIRNLWDFLNQCGAEVIVWSTLSLLAQASVNYTPWVRQEFKTKPFILLHTFTKSLIINSAICLDKHNNTEKILQDQPEKGSWTSIVESTSNFLGLMLSALLVNPITHKLTSYTKQKDQPNNVWSKIQGLTTCLSSAMFVHQLVLKPWINQINFSSYHDSESSFSFQDQFDAQFDTDTDTDLDTDIETNTDIDVDTNTSTKPNTHFNTYSTFKPEFTFNNNTTSETIIKYNQEFKSENIFRNKSQEKCNKIPDSNSNTSNPQQNIPNPEIPNPKANNGGPHSNQGLNIDTNTPNTDTNTNTESTFSEFSETYLRNLYKSYFVKNPSSLNYVTVKNTIQESDINKLISRSDIAFNKKGKQIILSKTYCNFIKTREDIQNKSKKLLLEKWTLEQSSQVSNHYIKDANIKELETKITILEQQPIMQIKEDKIASAQFHCEILKDTYKKEIYETEDKKTNYDRYMMHIHKNTYHPKIEHNPLFNNLSASKFSQDCYTSEFSQKITLGTILKDAPKANLTKVIGCRGHVFLEKINISFPWLDNSLLKIAGIYQIAKSIVVGCHYSSKHIDIQDLANEIELNETQKTTYNHFFSGIPIVEPDWKCEVVDYIF